MSLELVNLCDQIFAPSNTRILDVGVDEEQDA